MNGMEHLRCLQSHQHLVSKLGFVEFLGLGINPLLFHIGLAEKLFPLLLGPCLLSVLHALVFVVGNAVGRIKAIVSKGQAHGAAAKAQFGGGIVVRRRKKGGRLGLALASSVANVRGGQSGVFHFLQDPVAAKNGLDPGGGVEFLEMKNKKRKQKQPNIFESKCDSASTINTKQK